MPRVRILPLDVEIDCGDGESIMGAAQKAGYYWPTTCNGEGRCTTCACELLEGGSALEPMGNAERKTLVEERGEGVLRTAVRLACQLRFQPGAPGPAVVRKAGVRPPD